MTTARGWTRWPLEVRLGLVAGVAAAAWAVLVLDPLGPATIDPGYRGEIRVILLNLGKDDYVVHRGDRIAQMIVARYESVEWEEGELGDSARGTGGFGSSGS